MMGSPLLRSSLLALVAALTFTGTTAKKKPNIIFILLDDMGMADFQSTDPDMVTPNIERLRIEGLFLNQSYMLPSCGPSRSALLSGRYPHTWGPHVGTVLDSTSKFYPEKKLLYMGDVMKKLGYATHALGKWHQGFCHPSLRPLGRGFDTFYGMLSGAHSTHFYHSRNKDAYDWWNNNTIDFSANGTSSTKLLNDRMLRIINESEKKKPFFAYLAYQAAHKPWEVEKKYLQYCKHVKNDERKKHCAVVYAVDQGIGWFIDALKEKGIYDNTAIIVTSDNGGIDQGSHNYPLRGRKGNVYEGGCNVYTVLKAPGLRVVKQTWPGLIHAVDWMPTLVGMAGGKKEKWMHGLNLWPDIKAFGASNRTEIFYDFEDRNETKKYRKAYRSGPWKIIQGIPGIGPYWYPPYNVKMEPMKLPKNNWKWDSFQLFNLAQDPYEKNDLAAKEPKTLEKLKKKMKKFLKLYKLKPFVKPESGTYKNPKTGYINTCFCHPPWAEDTPDCPSP